MLVAFNLNRLPDRILELIRAGCFENPANALHVAVSDALLDEQVRRTKNRAGQDAAEVRLILPLLDSADIGLALDGLRHSVYMLEAAALTADDQVTRDEYTLGAEFLCAIAEALKAQFDMSQSSNGLTGQLC